MREVLYWRAGEAHLERIRLKGEGGAAAEEDPEVAE